MYAETNYEAMGALALRGDTSAPAETSNSEKSGERFYLVDTEDGPVLLRKYQEAFSSHVAPHAQLRRLSQEFPCGFLRV